jgi:hypothetical protein
MTDTETISVLLGFRHATQEERDSMANGSFSKNWWGFRDGKMRVGPSDWPDLDDWNWIRRMEDALAEKGLLPRYIMELLSQPYTEAQDLERRSLGFVNEVFWFFTRATPAQRVAACLRVLQDAGL